MKILAILFVVLFGGCSHKINRPDYSEKAVLGSEFHAEAHDLMISSQGKGSTLAGLEVAKLGGNIIDVFVAVSFAISVERPQSTGIGGGGFLLYYDPNTMDTPISLDFREVAPISAHQNMYLNSKGKPIKGKSLTGIDASGVPGLVDGVLMAHRKWGKLPLDTLLKPAIKMARSGFTVYPELEFAINYKKDDLKKFVGSQKIFFHPNGKPLKAGDILYQKDLAKTLELISKNGRKGFYKGEVAKKITLTSKKLGSGFIRPVDLSSYKTKQRAPVSGSYKGHKIFSMGPPSSGGVHIVQILNILENFELRDRLSVESINVTSQAMNLAFQDRAKYLGDSDFVKVPTKGLLSKKYAHELSKKIKGNNIISENNTPNTSDPFDYESSETTHFSIMDKQGRVVVSTQTINGFFGSSVVVDGTGIVMNNEMDDFAVKVGASNLFGAIGGKNNLISPKKRPLSSMSPTIVLKKNSKDPLMAVGTPSGTRILTCVMQTILNFLEYDLGLFDSVASLRYHHQWRPNYIRVEEGGFQNTTKKQLENLGHKVVKKNLGCRVQAITKNGKKLVGVSDPRGEGSSKGL